MPSGPATSSLGVLPNGRPPGSGCGIILNYAAQEVAQLALLGR
jgi:hypothetical protein